MKVASKREVLRRDWCVGDPILKELPNLKMQAATNYKIASPQARRLAALWSRTGRDWTRNEALAGLWAYDRTSGGPISSLPEIVGRQHCYPPGTYPPDTVLAAILQPVSAIQTPTRPRASPSRVLPVAGEH